MPAFKPPPLSWRPELKGTSRSWHWYRAAGVNKDGSAKRTTAHVMARVAVLRKDKIRLINAKDDHERTPEDVKSMEKEANFRANDLRRSTERNALPENKEPRAAANKKWSLKNHKQKADAVNKFIGENGVDASDEPLSDEDAFMFIRGLMEDKDSALGRDIFNALGGMSLKEAFWDGQATSSIYALSARGDPTIGGTAAESINFLTCRPEGFSILSRTDGNKNFRFKDQAFKDLCLDYVPIYVTSSYANCTTMESAFQLFFDFLPVGSHRLWKQSGAGGFSRTLRTLDMKYIEKTGDTEPKFMFGITILPNVAVIERGEDANGKEIVISITGGKDIRCNVNQPIKPKPVMNASQEAARAAVYATLPPHFVAKAAELSHIKQNPHYPGGV
ncbi:hypothetical protein T484DRAFT_1758330 [Baffinella frigidus]|nr:hypothetical protein T484DRAFT_1758330 [Cryptophyta sp. CCMP2293]